MKIVQMVKSNQNMQVLMQLLGLALMLMNFLFIIPYLKVVGVNE